MVDIYYVDSWDSEVMFIEINGKKVLANTWGFTGGNATQCGNSIYNDGMLTHVFEFTHTSSYIDIKFYSSLNEPTSNESWGFRNL